MTTDEDTRLLDDLRDMWWQADPPPPGLTPAMVAAVAAADLDREWELLTLVRDSADEPAAQVRGLATARVLYFTAIEGWSLDTEIDDGQVRGQLLDFTGDMATVEVTVETRAGQAWTTELDEIGFFALRAEPTGWSRFVVRIGESVASSHWVEL
jgi:hypothetical protein